MESEGARGGGPDSLSTPASDQPSFAQPSFAQPAGAGEGAGAGLDPTGALPLPVLAYGLGDPAAASTRTRSPWRKGAGAAAGTAAVATKAGLLAKVFVALKALLVIGKFKTLATMLVSVVAYSWIFGWKYAVGFVALMFVHEMGHVFAFRAQGVKVSAPMFVPFLGAFVEMGETQSVRQESLGAVAGPATGAAAAVAVLAVADSTGSLLLQALAYSGFFLNLFNLLPMLPLDGGRAAAAVHPALWGLGLAGAVVLAVTHPSPVLFLVLVLGSLEMFRRWKAHRRGETHAYYSLSGSTRGLVATAYLSTAAICLLGMHLAYVPR